MTSVDFLRFNLRGFNHRKGSYGILMKLGMYTLFFDLIDVAGLFRLPIWVRDLKGEVPH